MPKEAQLTKVSKLASFQLHGTPSPTLKTYISSPLLASDDTFSTVPATHRERFEQHALPSEAFPFHTLAFFLTLLGPSVDSCANIAEDSFTLASASNSTFLSISKV